MHDRCSYPQLSLGKCRPLLLHALRSRCRCSGEARRGVQEVEGGGVMIRRGNEQSGAIFSDCEKYRYVLWRQWDLLDPEPCFMAFVGLNPSTADESLDDPTIRRC